MQEHLLPDDAHYSMEHLPDLLLLMDSGSEQSPEQRLSDHSVGLQSIILRSECIGIHGSLFIEQGKPTSMILGPYQQMELRQKYTGLHESLLREQDTNSL